MRTSSHQLGRSPILLVVLFGVIAACGQQVTSERLRAIPSPSGSSGTPSASPSPVSSELQALEAALRSAGRSVDRPVAIRGSLALAPAPSDAKVVVGRDAALVIAEKQPAFAAARAESPDLEPLVRLVLLSQYPPGATDLPEGGSTTRHLAWIFVLEHVPDPGGGVGGGITPDGTPAGPPPGARSLVDVAVSVDATTGIAGPTFVWG